MKRKLTRSAVLDIVNRRARGETLTAIAEVHGVSRNAVRYRLDNVRQAKTKRAAKQVAA